MRYAKTLVCLFGFLVGVSLTARADNTACTGAIWIVPDGSPHEGTFAASPEERWFIFLVQLNRSYVLYTENLSPTDVQTIVGQINRILGSCVAGTPPTVRDISQIEPYTSAAIGSIRISLVSGTTDTFQFAVRTFGTPGRFRVRVVETTLFSPRWSTFGGFYTSWGIQNTTSASCSVTLTVKNTAGTTVANPTFSVAAGAIVFRDTRATDLNVAASQAGQVTLTHDCPPGGVHADAFMVNEGVVPPVVVPVVFAPRTP